MIVTSVESGWEVVFQRSHGLLAGQIAERFRDDLKPELWVETLDTICSHDDNKEPFDATNYVTKLGAPKDFTLVSFSDRKRVEEAKRRITDCHRTHRWCGLLMSRHVEHLYGGEAEVSDEMRELLDSEHDRRKSVLRAMKRKIADLESAYKLLQWCDRCSLILVRGNVPAMQRRIDIVEGLADERHQLFQRDDETIAIEPWPFEPDEFLVGVEVHTLNQLAFADDRELIDCIESSDTETRSWRLRR